MCGIAGIVQPENQGAVDPGILRRMNESQRHRGPDDEGYYLKGPVGLAMRRLKIIDLEGGHQPLANETEDVWTVFNGEIYNFRELRDELITKGHRFHTATDTEVIVHLYEEEGEDFVGRLRGMFAIALWDEKAQKLLLIRDRIGIKPLHYWFQGGTLAFASEIKALLECPAVGRELSLTALNDYLSFLYIPAPRTIYQEIQKLPPGHWARYQHGKFEIRPYWDFNGAVEAGRSEHEWIELLREALEESVRAHLVSDVPLGAFLSGGMDSSTVVAWMSRTASEPVKTYSIGFPDSRFNELPYARKVAKRFETEHHEEMVEAGAFELLPKIVSLFDEPFADSSGIPTYLVSRFARSDVTVALSGDGGDELFGGYLWTQKEIWLERFRRLPPFFGKGMSPLFLKKGYRPLREKGFWNAVRRFYYDAALSPAESYARRAMCFQPWMLAELLQPSVLEESRGEGSLDLIRSFFERSGSRSLIDQFLYLDSKIYLPDDLLTKVDRMSMAHSLEVRVPLLDHKLAELAFSMPHSLKMKSRTTKYILKQAMRGLLPRGILRQRKQGFSIPLERWFRNELYSFARKILVEDEPVSRRYFRLDYVRWLLEAHRRGAQNFGSQLYALVVFEIWCRTNLNPEGRVSSLNLSLKDLSP
ncbi:MAG: asparagine synthase (glutamine-hydrolyzing) [Candidatus Omnitrophica bacterium]|nr:asparagine synthase (glutamine-hydrolyzing) [Candidatus Omnitrophota bacterium]